MNLLILRASECSVFLHKSTSLRILFNNSPSPQVLGHESGQLEV